MFAYVAVLTVVNVVLAGIDEASRPLVSAVITASVVVFLFNPLYGRLKAMIDRLFFPTATMLNERWSASSMP